MLELLDKENKIFVLVREDSPNTFYLSFQNYTKCIINIKIDKNNIIILPVPQGECTTEELNIIIDKFTNYLFTIKPEIDGIMFNTDPTPLLESIGFKLTNEDSEYLYKENKRINKVR